MEFKIGKTTFYPKEILKSPLHFSIVFLLFIFFSNVFTMWGEVFTGRSPYGSSEDFQTRNGEFKYQLQLHKLKSPAEAISELNNAFDEFKEERPTFKYALLYRTSEYYNLSAWKFWKWYRYFEKGYILSYPYLNTNAN